MFEILRDGEGIAWSSILQGAAALDGGEHGRARDILGEGPRRPQRAGYREGAAWALDQLGVRGREGENERAASHPRESGLALRDLGDRWRTASLLEESAVVASSLGRFERGAPRGAETLREALSDPVPPRERADRERGVEAARKGWNATPSGRLRQAGAPRAWNASTSTRWQRRNRPTPRPPRGPRPSVWSAREAEVLGLVAEGLTDPEVAKALYLSPGPRGST